MAASSILGAYYLALKIRQHHLCARDPDLSFVTHSHLEKLRREFIRTMSEAARELRALRAEIREDTRSMQRQYAASLAQTRELISQNAQNISALSAQAALQPAHIGARRKDRQANAKNERINRTWKT